MIAVSYHGSVNDLQALGLDDHAPDGPFNRLDWFTLLENHARVRPLFVVAQDGHDFAIIPLAQERSHLAPLANWYSFTWSPLVSKTADRAAMLTAIARDLKARGHTVDLSGIPDDGTHSDIRGAFKSAGWITHLTKSDTNHILPVNGRSYSAYLTDRPGRLRTTLKRKTKHVVTRIIPYFDNLAWDNYETIYAASWKPEEGLPTMLRAFARQEGDAGRIRLGIASHDGKPVAAQFWTVENGVAYIHKLAHLEEATQLSAGTVLTAALMEHVIDIDRVELVDFGTGDDAYKRDWMEAVRTRWRLKCYDPRNPRVWPSLAKAYVRSLASNKRAG